MSVGALPAIVPVRYELQDEHIVFDPAPAPASGPAVSFADAVIAFEADAFDAAGAEGWSVLVVGRAESAAETGMTRIPSDHITGRWFEWPGPFPGLSR